MSNPIQQAIDGLEWIQLVFTDDTMAQERDPELWLPKLNEALSALQSLQGVELPKPAATLHDDGYWTPQGTEEGRNLNSRLARAGTREGVYTVDQLRTAVAAALARGAVPQGWKRVPVEPTPEMRKAAADAWLDCDSKLFLNKAGAAVRAAIAISKESA